MKPTLLRSFLLFVPLLFAVQFSLGQECEDNNIYVVLATGNWGEEVSWDIVDSLGDVIADGSGYESNSAYADSLCVPDGCYTFNMYDSFGDGWNGGFVSVLTDTMVVGFGQLTEGSMGSFDFGVNDESCFTEIIFGCTDPEACEYDSTADVDDGSCVYGGCTDTAALNYDPTAACDDGSCDYPEPCDMNGLLLYMYDSFGDSWNGASYVITNDGGEVVAEGALTVPGGIEIHDLCLADGCYAIAVGGGSFDSEISWEILSGEDLIVDGGAPSITGFGLNADGCELTGGCTDSTACEYNADADYDDGSCTYGGCTDTTALNYDSTAGCDDGSCEYPEPCDLNSLSIVMMDSFGDAWNGATYVISNEDGEVVAEGEPEEPFEGVDNLCFADGCYTIAVGGGAFDSEISWEIFLGEEMIASGGAPSLSGFGVNAEGCELTGGCLDSTACEYNADADYDDGSCTYPGCNDSTALNYDSTAGCDDGSCEYPEPCDYTSVILTLYDSFGDGWTTGGYTISNDGGVVAEGTLSEGDMEVHDLCLEDGCYVMNVVGDGFPSEMSWTISVGGEVIAEGGAPSVTGFGINAEGCEPVGGCTDTTACEYDADADYDDGSCTYPGCNDSTALNYDSTAGCDDGSCNYPDPCDYTTAIITLYDSFGDGWTTGYYSISNDGGVVAEGTLEGSMDVHDVCLEDGCYVMEVVGDGFPSEMSWSIAVDGQVITEGGAPFIGGFGINAEGCEFTVGCTDPDACEYDSTAEVDDGSCTFPGCTDPDALNYNPFAGCDDGSCENCENGIQATLYVCTLVDGFEMEMDIVDENGDVVIGLYDLPAMTVLYFDICLEEGMCYTVNMWNNTDEGWNGGYYWIVVDGVQITTEFLDDNLAYEQVNFSLDGESCPTLGCTDSAAVNYDSEAEMDDGSCIYPPDCDLNLVALTTTTGNWPEEVSWTVSTEEGEVVAESDSFAGGGTFYQWACLADGCYVIDMYDSFGDGWNGGTLTAEVNGATETYALEGGSSGVAYLGINTEDCGPIYGCTDPEACNYNADASDADDSCTYPGCNDPEALNYDSTAGCDDGSCEYPEPCDYTSAIVTLYDSFGDGWTTGFYTISNDGGVVAEGTLSAGDMEVHALCLEDGCYVMEVVGDGFPSEMSWTISVGGEVIAEGGAPYLDGFGINAEDCGLAGGCTDTTACEYDADADYDDGSCTYGGCTDTTALNYDSTAGCDDGSCEYPEPCDNTSVVVTLYDSFGDGWTSGFYTISNDGGVVAEGTLSAGEMEVHALCLEDGCYVMEVVGDGFPSEMSWTISVGGEVIAEGGAPYIDGFGINADGCELVGGCTDSTACEYDADADYDDGSCTYGGCTDTTALNYDSTAGCDDGSCEYPEPCDLNALTINMYDTFGDAWNGATYVISNEDGEVVAEGALEEPAEGSDALCLADGCYTILVGGGAFDSEILWEIIMDGEVIADGGAPSISGFGVNAEGCELVGGCTDSTACEYNADADYDDGSCTYGGCTDTTALNYDSTAGCDDGSCEYPEPCDNTSVVVTLYDSFGDGWTSGFYTISNDGGVVAEGTLSEGEMEVHALCLEDGCYVMEVVGDGFPSEMSWTISVGGEVIAEGGAPAIAGFGVNADGCELVGGCTDSTACQYNADADYDDGSCTYGGCTDTTALNYDSTAGCDDGSCEYPEPCDLNALTINMYDTFGDAWNGATYVISNDDGEVVAEGALEEPAEGSDALCLADGCYTILVGGGAFDSEILWEITMNGEVIADGGAPSISGFGVNAEGCELVGGCTDSTACEYNAGADYDDGSCTYPGCNDSEALNYDPYAGCDDGSCEYPEPCDLNSLVINMYDAFGDDWNGAGYVITNEGGDVVAEGGLDDGESMGADDLCLADGCYGIAVGGGSFDSEISWDITMDGEVIAGGGAPTIMGFGVNAEGCELVGGCTDSTACEYNADADYDDGSCTYPGCMDSEALNYDSTAGCDDGSCEYPEPCDANEVTMWVNTQGFPSEVSWDLVDGGGDVVAEGSGYEGGDVYHDLCLEDGCYTLNMYDSFGDGWNGGFYMMYDDDGLISDGSLLYGSWQMDIISINSDCDTDGCTDPIAINYDPDADEDDGSCVYGGGNGNGNGSDIAEFESGFTLTISPNPIAVAGKMTLANINDESGVAIKVMDLSGRIVYQELIAVSGPQMTVDIDMSGIAAGNYIIHAQNGVQTAALQLIKMK